MENSTANPDAMLNLTSSIEQLSQYLSNLLVVDAVEGTSLISNSSVFPCNGSSTITKQATGIRHSCPAPTPLYSQAIWAINGSGDEGSLNLRPCMADFPVSFNYGDWYNNNNCVQADLDGLLGDAAANYEPVPEGKRGLYPGMANGNPSVGLVHQEGLESTVGYSELLECYSFLAEASSLEGSHKLQDMLRAKDPETTRKIFEKAYSVIFHLMCDLYGGHVLTGLIAACDESQLELIMLKIYKNPDLFINAACTRFGLNTIKRLIKSLQKSPLISVVIRILSARYIDLMVHSVGRFAVLECVKTLKPEQLELLYREAIKFCLELAEHKAGCISLNELVTHSQNPYREILQRLISYHAVPLSYHPIGNYVVQNVLNQGSPRYVLEICTRLKGHYAKLSSMKVGSHVVEKCLNSMARKYAIEDLLESDRLLPIARNEYGNYVIQTALRATKGANSPLHGRLLKKLQQRPDSLQSTYGKNVMRLITNGIPVNEA